MRSVITAALAAAALAQSQTIVEIAAADPDLATLVFALQAGGLVDTLSGPGPFTVFAPINPAFDALGRNILDFVLNPDNKDQLDAVLTYHVAAGEVYSSQLTNGEKIPTLDNKLTSTVNITDGTVYINQAKVIRANINASNGVIHIIDGVLVPSNFALPPNDIVHTALATSTLSTLVAAVEAANLTDALSMPNGPYTVFAPTNAAFAKLPAGELNYLLAHPAELANILFYHLLDRRVYADEIQNFERVRTIQGQDIVFIISGGKVLINGNSTVIAANIGCTNGVVHLIDTVILPQATKERAAAWNGAAPNLPNIVELAQSVPDLSTLVTAVAAGGLVNTLEGPGPFTVFAPNNQAFASLPNGVLNYLLGNIKALDTVLTYHVVAGAISSNQIRNGAKVPTVEGQNVTATVLGQRIFINEALVIAPNNQASNGIVHIIDQVLLPQGAPSVLSKLRGSK